MKRTPTIHHGARGPRNFSRRWRARAGHSLCVPGNEVVMRRIHTSVRALFGVTVVAGGLVALAPAAQAITIPVACSENALVAAVNLANSTSAADTLVLAGGCT